MELLSTGHQSCWVSYSSRYCPDDLGVSAGGLYEATQASQGKSGSAVDVMSAAKLKITGRGINHTSTLQGVWYNVCSIHVARRGMIMSLDVHAMGCGQ